MCPSGRTSSKGRAKASSASAARAARCGPVEPGDVGDDEDHAADVDVMGSTNGNSARSFRLPPKPPLAGEYSRVGERRLCLREPIAGGAGPFERPEYNRGASGSWEHAFCLRTATC